jgi:D-alanine--poly(phosphoribitol) ligase subunit 2
MEEKILDILETICEDSVVREERHIDLFEEDLLDSLGFAELLVNIEQELGIVISPSEVTREDMNTPEKIIQMVMEKA